ncbi:MAG: winged helix-turn-helix transcriptional regulator [Fibrella sp.]|nr:winged helix-turn-helix transcriptional regulator [Armatimonadota bacterium]
MSDSDRVLTRQSRICLGLMRLGTRMASQFDAWFAEHEITQAQFRVLLAVWQLADKPDHVTPSALADYLFIERPTATILIAKLVERSLLARVPDETDRRSHRLRLTPSGGNLLSIMGPIATAKGGNTLAPFTDGEQETFLALLARLEAHLRSGTDV